MTCCCINTTDIIILLFFYHTGYTVRMINKASNKIILNYFIDVLVLDFAFCLLTITYLSNYITVSNAKRVFRIYIILERGKKRGEGGCRVNIYIELQLKNISQKLSTSKQSLSLLYLQGVCNYFHLYYIYF